MTGTFLSGRFGAQLGLDRTILSGTVLGAAAGLTAGRAGLERRPDGGGGDRPDVRVRDRTRPRPANGMAGAVGPFPRMAGLAAAVAGFLQMTGSALYSVAVGHF